MDKWNQNILSYCIYAIDETSGFVVVDLAILDESTKPSS
jgi:hypothetical protein